MSRGALRMTEEQWAEQSSKRTRWQKGSEIVDTAPAEKPVSCLTPSKYRNVKTDGYDSKKEASRAAALKFLEKQGVIRNLSEQVKFVLIPKQEGERACSYFADFCYEEDTRTPMQETRVWTPVVEDCKGMKTDAYRIKRKLMLFVHGVRVRET